jgi:hypothetical protein
MSKAMMARIGFHHLKWMLAIVSVHAAHAQFTLFSQNTLHFGWGQDPKYSAKNTYMTGCVVTTTPTSPCTTKSTWDVAILQEVMNGNELDDPLYPQNPTPGPGTYLVLMTDYQGKSTYREAYAFMVRVPVNSGDCCTVSPATTNNQISIYTGGTFSRPPAGIVVAEHGRQTWIVDYHAIFGKVGDRRIEVSQMGNAIAWFQSVLIGNTPGAAVSRYIVGGDWNFPADDAAFTNIGKPLAAPITVLPTGLTSLTPTGGLSSSYDHFVWAPTLVTINVSTTNPQIVQPPGGKSLADFRKEYSDHLGISVSVQ